MTTTKRNKIIYWIATIWLSLGMVATGIVQLMKMKEVADFIEPFRKMWDDRFNKLESIMKKYKSKK